MQQGTTSFHAGHKIDPTTGALTAPIHLSTTFKRRPDGSYPLEFQYSRLESPNRAALEDSLTALEGGVQAAAFASGSAAAMTVLQALRPGDHLLAPHDMYFGIRKLIRDVFIPWGLEATFVDMTDLDEVQNGVQTNTTLILVETPSNPLLRVTDIHAVVEITTQPGAGRGHLAQQESREQRYDDDEQPGDETCSSSRGGAQANGLESVSRAKDSP